MVLLHVKRSEKESFLYETPCATDVDVACAVFEVAGAFAPCAAAQTLALVAGDADFKPVVSAVLRARDALRVAVIAEPSLLSHKFITTGSSISCRWRSNDGGSGSRYASSEKVAESLSDSSSPSELAPLDSSSEESSSIRSGRLVSSGSDLLSSDST